MKGNLFKAIKCFVVLVVALALCGTLLVSTSRTTVFVPGDEGCTPGYWKNHLGSWPPTGYSPNDNFDTVFGVNYFDPDITLEQAVNARGGGLNKLARHGTAALLNAAHPGLAYPLSVAEVMALVQYGLADSLANFNEYGCPLNSDPW